MPFDNTKWLKPAERGDVGGIALDAAIAVRAINDALRKLADKSGTDLHAEIAEIEKYRKALFDTFVELTGWTNER